MTKLTRCGRRHSWLLAFVVALFVQPASAQPDDPPLRHLQVALAGGLLGGTDAGRTDANLRGNSQAGAMYRLFAARTRLGAARQIEARVGLGLTTRVAVESAIVFSRPELRASVSDDVEGASALTVAERIDRYRVEGGVVISLEELRVGRRTLPVVVAGAGYLRQLHKGRTAVEHGYSYYAGGGVRHWLLMRSSGVVRAAGLRADLRVYGFGGGVAVDSPKPRAAVSGSFVVSF